MYNIQAIKDQIDCLTIAKRCGLPVNKPGDRCISPLRAGASNKTSFVVYSDFWYDFGSARGGDVIDLVAELEYDGDKGAAIRALARETGVDGTDDDGWREYTTKLNAQTAYYHSKLTDDDRAYLHNRGLSDEDINRLMIGRVTDGHLRGRLFLPYFFNGYVCYYATRAMPGGAYPDRKYMKQQRDDYCQHMPWGLQTLDRGNDTLVIAEGYFDAAAFEAQGYPVLSAVTGFFSSSQLPMVLSAARQFKRVFFVYDNDAVSHAGEKFAEKTARILLRERIPFIVGHVPTDYKDVSEYYENGEPLQSLVNNAVGGLTYLSNLYSDPDELAAFLRPIAHSHGIAAVRRVIDDLSESGTFTARELKNVEKIATSPPSEAEIADKLIQKYGLLYLSKAGFYEWDGHVWKLIADDVVRAYAAQEYGEHFRTAARNANACSHVRDLVVDNSVVFNKKPVLTFPNGTLELETGVFRESRRDDYCTFMMSYDYNPNSVCPVWEQFITDITNGCGKRYENLQFIPGYALMPHCKLEKIFVLLGGGGNGKTVYLNIIKRVFGHENISAVLPSGLVNEFQRIMLKDSLLNIGSDISSDFTKGEIREYLLQISSGEMIQACYKGKTHITFEPRCKLVFACNSVPTAEIINGLDRRMHFVKFPCSFVDDPDPADPLQKKIDVELIDKLIAELPGIFNWVYKGYQQLKQQGWIVETDEQSEILNQFRTTSNPIMEFCEDKTFAGTMSRDEIYSWYRDWCDAAGHKALSRTKFIPKFREVMGKNIIDEQSVRQDGGRVRVFKFK